MKTPLSSLLALLILAAPALGQVPPQTVGDLIAADQAAVAADDAAAAAALAAGKAAADADARRKAADAALGAALASSGEVFTTDQPAASPPPKVTIFTPNGSGGFTLSTPRPAAAIPLPGAAPAPAPSPPTTVPVTPAPPTTVPTTPPTPSGVAAPGLRVQIRQAALGLPFLIP